MFCARFSLRPFRRECGTRLVPSKVVTELSVAALVVDTATRTTVLVIYFGACERITIGTYAFEFKIY